MCEPLALSEKSRVLYEKCTFWDPLSRLSTLTMSSVRRYVSRPGHSHHASITFFFSPWNRLRILYTYPCKIFSHTAEFFEYSLFFRISALLRLGSSLFSQEIWDCLVTCVIWFIYNFRLSFREFWTILQWQVLQINYCFSLKYWSMFFSIFIYEISIPY
jgi:hypothetical protein